MYKFTFSNTFHLRRNKGNIHQSYSWVNVRVNGYECNGCDLQWRSGKSSENAIKICRHCKMIAQPVNWPENMKIINEKKLTPYQGKKRCFGEFRCNKCNLTWTSSNSWANSSQDCQRCKLSIFPHRQRFIEPQQCHKCNRSSSPVRTSQLKPKVTKNFDHLEYRCPDCNLKSTNLWVSESQICVIRKTPGFAHRQVNSGEPYQQYPTESIYPFDTPPPYKPPSINDNKYDSITSVSNHQIVETTPTLTPTIKKKSCGIRKFFSACKKTVVCS